MQVLGAGALYSVLVFGAGFLLGPIRILWGVPRFGTRMAELMEMPVMLAVIVVAARWVCRRLAVPSSWLARLGVGLVALVLLLGAEFALVLRLRGLTIGEYPASRDPVAGAAYAVALVILAVVPMLVVRGVRR